MRHVAIFHSADELQRQAAHTLQDLYRTKLDIEANIFARGARWGWNKGDHATMHFLCSHTGFDDNGRFYVALRDGVDSGQGGAALSPASGAGPGARGEQRLCIVDVVSLLLEDLKLGGLLVVLEGLERGTYAERAVASLAAALEKVWGDNGSSLARRLLQRLVVVVPEGGRLGALGEALVEVEGGFEGGYDQGVELRQLYAATAGREVYLLQQGRGELQQLRAVSKVLCAARLVAGRGAMRDACVLFHACDDDYGVSRDSLKATLIRSSWTMDGAAGLPQGSAPAVAGGAPLPALMFDLVCGDTSAFGEVRDALVRMHGAEGFRPMDPSCLVRQCASAVMGRAGEPDDGGDELVVAVALLLTLDRGGMLWWLLRDWQRACELAEYLSELLEEGCDLRSAEYEPLALLRALEEEDANRRLEDDCVALINSFESTQINFHEIHPGYFIDILPNRSTSSPRIHPAAPHPMLSISTLPKPSPLQSPVRLQGSFNSTNAVHPILRNDSPPTHPTPPRPAPTVTALPAPTTTPSSAPTTTAPSVPTSTASPPPPPTTAPSVSTAPAPTPSSSKAHPFSSNKIHPSSPHSCERLQQVSFLQLDHVRDQDMTPPPHCCGQTGVALQHEDINLTLAA